MNSTTFRSTFPWKAYAMLIALSILAAAGYLPYTDALLGSVQQELGLTRTAFRAVTFLQTMLVLITLSFFGLFFSRRGGLKTPYLDALVSRIDIRRSFRKTALLSLIIGVSTGFLLFGIDTLIAPFMDFELAQGSSLPGPLAGLAVSLYGGIAEEIMLRLFLVNLLLFLLVRIFRKEASSQAVVLAIIISAFFFGLLHVLSSIAVVEMDTLFTIRTISLNMSAGIIFGLVYWKWGLLPAMICHGSADIVLHVIAAL